ncbi:hypothetical protein GH741_10635 [Aquibacillus halophilus]|uniref:Uncharacterized protein n=2 Tax=Aquibacillus halophilus TaxID=930132 RepID=A0A6A8DBN8_9BACI|nr:hypothetical protein [Aquibacillus halophilus]
MTHYDEEQLKIETLFQMGKAQIKQELPSQSSSISTLDQYTYTFPYGTVKIIVLLANQSSVTVEFNITTSENSIHTTVTNIPLN